MLRRRKSVSDEAELNVTSFMNLMIVLVPVLLLNMVFSQLAVLDLRLPKGDGGEELDPASLSLQVLIRKNNLEIVRTYQVEMESLVIIPKINMEYDFETLNRSLANIKKQALFSDRTDISLLSQSDIDYQTIIHVMDSVRQHTAVVAANAVVLPLFPDISLGDIEDSNTLNDEQAIAAGGDI